jgi:hypothetical protein
VTTSATETIYRGDVQLSGAYAATLPDVMGPMPRSAC